MAWYSREQTKKIYKYFPYICLILIVFDIFTTVYSVKNMIESNDKESIKNSGQAISSYVEFTRKLGEAIAEDPMVRDNSKTLVERAAKLDSYTKAYDLFMVGIVDRNGYIGSSIRHKRGYIGYREYLQKVFETKETVLTDMYFAGADNSTKVYTVCVPIFDKNDKDKKEVVGAVMMAIYFDRIEKIVNERSNDYIACSLIDSQSILSVNSMKDRQGKVLSYWFDKALWRSMNDENVMQNLFSRTPFSYWGIIDGVIEHVEYVPLHGTNNWTISMRVNVLRAYSIIFISLAIKILAYIALFWFFSLRKNREILEHDKLFNMISINTDDAFVIFNVKKHRTEYVSYNITSVFGVEREKILQNFNIITTYLGTDIETVIKQLESLQHKMVSFEKNIDEKIFILKVYLVEQGDNRKIIVIIRDCTEEKQKNQLLQEMAVKAEKANIAKTVFLSAMSHDIRTPMNAIMGMTVIARQHLNELPRVVDCLDKIEISSKYLLNLIDEVLEMSKIENNRIVLKEEAADLKKIIDDILSMLKVYIQQKQQNLTVDLSEMKHSHVYVDKEKLQKILVNIISNAIKYTDIKGELQLAVKEHDCDNSGTYSYRFIVSDNGIGISREFLPKLFLPFEREINSVTNKVHGTGLGLTISKRIAKMMKGDITVKSEVGQGSVFTVEVKLKVQHAIESCEQVTVLPEKEVKELPDYTGKRVLVVEDNELNYEIIAEILGCMNIIVEWAENGLLAVEKVQASEFGYYDLVFMDIQMPIMNGYIASENIRRLERADAGKMPIIALSANAFSEDSHKAYAAGMNEHLAKPIDIKKLCAVLEKYFSRRS